MQDNNTLPRFISVTNQKGGVGKTTTSVNVAASLAHLGFKTLLIDLDPQGNASSGVGVDRHSSSTIYDVLIGQKDLLECIQPTGLENLFVIPANPNLIGAEVELINAISREKKLKSALKKLPSDFKFVIFDCPPSLGLLTINAFTASHSLIIPTQCEYYALEGLGQLLTTYQIVKEDLNESLEIEGVVLTMYDPRNKLTHEVVKELRQHFPEKLYDAVIPRNVKLSESPSFGKPIILYDAESKGCSAYVSLSREILGRLGIDIEDRPNAAQQDVLETEAAAVPTETVAIEEKIEENQYLGRVPEVGPEEAPQNESVSIEVQSAVVESREEAAEVVPSPEVEGASVKDAHLTLEGELTDEQWRALELATAPESVTVETGGSEVKVEEYTA
jgi:chromosome partitioning protein